MIEQVYVTLISAKPKRTIDPMRPRLGPSPCWQGCLQWPPPQLLPVTKWNPAMQPAQWSLFSPWNVSRRHGNMENAHSKLKKTLKVIWTVLSGPPQQMSYTGLAEVALFALWFETLQWRCGNPSQPPLSFSPFMLIQWYVVMAIRCGLSAAEPSTATTYQSVHLQVSRESDT